MDSFGETLEEWHQRLLFVCAYARVLPLHVVTALVLIVLSPLLVPDVLSHASLAVLHVNPLSAADTDMLIPLQERL